MVGGYSPLINILESVIKSTVYEDYPVSLSIGLSLYMATTAAVDSSLLRYRKLPAAEAGLTVASLKSTTQLDEESRKKKLIDNDWVISVGERTTEGCEIFRVGESLHSCARLCAVERIG